jgi:small subunit ribosomal protein S7
MRRKRSYKREHSPDVKYGRIAIGRFINYLTADGKKNAAEKCLYGALDILKEKGNDPVEIFEKAVENASPMIEVVSRRVGGANYQVPREVRPERKFMLACRWLISAANSKKGQGMAKKLAEEFLAASKNEGSAIKKKQDIHRMAEANRAFAHFAW